MRALASSLFLALSAASLANAQTVTRGPYLQNMTPNSVTVQWRTDAGTNSVVWYGSSPASLTNQVTVAGPATDHIVVLPNLPARSTHYYTVGTTSGPLIPASTNQVFTTAPVPGTPGDYRMWVLGDPGKIHPEAIAVHEAFKDYNGTNKVDGIIMLGDNAYNNGYDWEYQAAMFDRYTQELLRWPVWSTRGNHERDPVAYYSIFTHPTAGEAGGVASGSEAYYSFDYGSVHFVCLDSFITERTVNGAMMTWLEFDLMSTTQEWIVVFFHHPPYSKGSHDSDNPLDSEGRLFDMRERFTPVFENYGVDLVLSGHSHSYERSYLMHGHTGLSSTFDPETMVDDGGEGDDNTGYAYNKASSTGTVYVVSGSSGQSFGGVTKHPAMVRYLEQAGSVSLEVSTNQLEAVFINANGDITDRFQIRHEAGLVPSIELSPAVNAGYDFLDIEADLISTGSAETVVRVFYGANPGSLVEDAWDHVMELGVQSNGLIQVHLPNLPPNSTVHYRFQARNAAGVQWTSVGGSSFVGSFTPMISIDEGQPVATNEHPVVLIDQGGDWNYLVTNAAATVDWNQIGFDDSGWDNGPAILGYGTIGSSPGVPLGTVIGYGNNASDKNRTTYFRKTFTVADPGTMGALSLELLRDDGAVIYLNGQELARDNMPAGPINYSTFAASTVGSANESTYFNLAGNPLPLVQGVNVLAVELHQASVNSSDLAFDLSLTVISNEVICVEPVLVDVTSTSAVLQAELISTGQAPTVVNLYYDSEDGGTTPLGWSDKTSAGEAEPGPQQLSITNLPPSSDCVIRFEASNSFGAVWTVSYEFTTEDSCEIGADTNAPVAVCSNTVLQLASNEVVELSAGMVDGGHTDACSSVTSQLSQTSFTPVDVRTNTIEVIIFDASGNSATCTAEVVVLDRDGLIDSDEDGVVNGDDPDDDDDQMPDDYENTHGLDRLDATDAGSDTDGDGMTALQEMIAGTEPDNGQSALFVEINIAADASSQVLSWFNATGRVYSIYCKTNLFSSQPWHLITNNIPNGAYTNYTDQSCLYFRVGVSNQTP